MFHYIHQLAANLVSLPFCAGQVEYSELLELFLLKTADFNTLRALSENQNVFLQAGKQKVLKDAKKLSREEENFTFKGNFLCGVYIILHCI